MGLTPFQATGRTVAQVVSRWPLTMEDWVQPQANPCGICNGQSNTGTGFSQEYFGFFPSGSFHQCTMLILSSITNAI